MQSYGQCMPGGPFTVHGIPTPTQPIRREGRDALTLANRPRPAVATVAAPRPRDIRAWAGANGMRINNRGAIPTAIRNAYHQAHTTPQEGPAS